MKTSFLIVFSLIFSCNCYSQNDTIYSVWSELDSKAENRYIMYKSKPLKFKNKNDVIAYYSPITDKEYYHITTGSEQLIIETKSNIGFDGVAVHNSLGGNYRGFSKIKNGKILDYTTYDTIGRIHSYYKYRFKNGDLYLIPFIEYYPNGMIKLKSKQKNLKYYGKYKEYYSNGKIKIIGKYDDKGNKIGKWKFYSEKGRLIKTVYNCGLSPMECDLRPMERTEKKETIKPKIKLDSIKQKKPKAYDIDEITIE